MTLSFRPVPSRWVPLNRRIGLKDMDADSKRKRPLGARHHMDDFIVPDDDETDESEAKPRKRMSMPLRKSRLVILDSEDDEDENDTENDKDERR